MSNWLDFLRSREFKIFVFFMLTFTLFIHWGGDNAWSRYDLTHAIAENGSLDITDQSHNTWDKAIRAEVGDVINRTQFEEASSDERTELVKGATIELFKARKHSIFSDKAPMSSFVAVPPYMIIDSLVNSETKDLWIDRPISDKPISLSYETSMKQFLIVLTTSVLPGSLLIVLIFYHLKNYIEDDKMALYSVIIAGIATPIFTYATSFFGVITAAFFGFASYTALQKGLTENNKSWIYLAGFLSAIAYSTEYYAAIISAVLVLLLLHHRRIDHLLRFGGAVFLGTMPLLIYHGLITGNPFIPPFMSSGLHTPGPVGSLCTLYTACVSHVYSMVPDPYRFTNVVFRLLFYPTRGLFFYSPILLLAIPGAYELYKRDKIKLVVFPGIFVLFVLFQSLQLNWLAGVSFGPRYAAVGLPFLILPVAMGLKRVVDKGRFCKVFVILVFLISSFNMFLGFQEIQEIEMGSAEYQDRFNSFSAIQPEFYSSLIGDFERYGPRSEVLMSLTDRHKGFDITHKMPYAQQFIELGSWNNNAVLFSTNLAPLMLVISLFLIFFGMESVWFRRIGISLMIIVLAASFSLSDSYVSGEFYRGENYAALPNSSIDTVFYLDEGEIPHIKARAFSNQSAGSNITININGEKRELYNSNSYSDYYLPFDVREGKNTIKIDAGKCERYWLSNNSLDTRCLSSVVQQISLKNFSELEQLLFVGGWYRSGKLSEKGAWMSERGTLGIKANSTGYRVLKINATQPSYIEDSELSINFNDEHLRTLESRNSPIYAIVKVEKGWNKLTMQSKCVEPSKFTNSSDNRCLSLHLNDLEFMAPNEMEKPLLSGFHEKYLEERPWLEKEGRIIFTAKEREIPVLKLGRTSLLKKGNLSISVNNRQIRVLESEDLNQEIRLVNASLEEGLNQMELESNKCVVPAQELKDSSDDRCLSFRLENLSFFSFELGSGWHNEERVGGDRFRWMNDKAEIIFSGDGETMSFSINAEPYPGLSESELEILVNGESVRGIKLNDSDRIAKNITVKSEEGINVLELQSTSGCEVPMEKERNSEDNRCLSFKVESLGIEGNNLWS